jgi:hypothetical protein
MGLAAFNRSRRIKTEKEANEKVIKNIVDEDDKNKKTDEEILKEAAEIAEKEVTKNAIESDNKIKTRKGDK